MENKKLSTMEIINLISRIDSVIGNELEKCNVPVQKTNTSIVNDIAELLKGKYKNNPVNINDAVTLVMAGVCLANGSIPRDIRLLFDDNMCTEYDIKDYLDKYAPDSNITIEEDTSNKTYREKVISMFRNLRGYNTHVETEDSVYIEFIDTFKDIALEYISGKLLLDSNKLYDILYGFAFDTTRVEPSKSENHRYAIVQINFEEEYVELHGMCLPELKFTLEDEFDVEVKESDDTTNSIDSIRTIFSLFKEFVGATSDGDSYYTLEFTGNHSGLLTYIRTLENILGNQLLNDNSVRVGKDDNFIIDVKGNHYTIKRINCDYKRASYTRV